MKEKIRRFRGPLLRWYRKHRRDLPWRDSSDPYSVWVSEVMLQQTRVGAVLPHYERFMTRFPDVCALADAPEEAVLAAWSGLGYYRRARSLRAAARVVVDRHGGKIPGDADRLRSLPGVGRYTAGAISSIAYGREEPVMDGNVRRVLCRLTATHGRDERPLWELARALVRGRDPGDLNQAIMELGALVCTPRSPRCSGCPLKAGCRARFLGRPEAYPRLRRPPRPETVRVAVALTRRNGRILLERPGRSSPFRGSWDLPALEISPSADPCAAIIRELRRRHGLTIAVGQPAGNAAHSILHRRLKMEAFDCRLLHGRPSRSPALRWIRLENLSETPVSGATCKLLGLAQNRSHGGTQTSSRPVSDPGSASTGRVRL